LLNCWNANIAALLRHPAIEVSFDPVAKLVIYHAAIEARDVIAIGAMLTDDATYQSEGLGPVRGRAAIVSAMENYFTQFPDHTAWDTELNADGPRAATSKWQLRATNTNSGSVVDRCGHERVAFNDQGYIVAVEVEDLT
jgi:ketosteroid isomerase-like protein